MPTSGEAKIHATSSYNLRSRPLPKTRPALANKENVQKSTATNSRIPQRKSKLPVRSTSRKPPASSATSTSGTKKSSQTRVRTVPNFEKLHKNWQKKFQQGKAVGKKPCTRTSEFDLTRPGTRFKRAYYSGDEHTDTEDEFQADQDALQSILDNRGLGSDVITGRSTVATMGGSRQITQVPEHRQTLGALPTHYSGRVNNAVNMPSAAKIPRHTTGLDTKKTTNQRKKSLVDEQFDADIEFEEDQDALATILNDTGIQSARDYSNMTRQTIASTHARTFQRTSIYYQKPKDDNKNKVYADFARLTIGGTLSPTVVKLRDFAASQTLPRNFTASSQSLQPGNLQRAAILNNASAVGRPTPGRSVGRPKTPGTASRVLNPRYQKAQDLSCSPALRVPSKSGQPRSALKMSNTQSRQGVRNVCWAEILESPSDKAVPMATKDKLATALFADEEAQKQQEELHRMEADTTSNRHKVEEMEAVELQLQMEIERLQREAAASSVQTNVPSSDMSQHQQSLPVPLPSHVPSHQQHFGQHLPTEVMETNPGLMSSVQTVQKSAAHLKQNSLHTSHLSEALNPHGRSVNSVHAVSQSIPGTSQNLRMDNIQTHFDQQGLITGNNLSTSNKLNSLPFGHDTVQQHPVLVHQNLHAEMPQVASNLQIREQTPSLPSRQFQQNSGIQRHGVVTSGPQERSLYNSNGSIGYNSFQRQQVPVPHSSEYGLRQFAGNQRPDASVVERPQTQSVSNAGIGTSTHSSSLSEVGEMVFSRRATEIKPANHKSFVQRAQDRVILEPSIMPAERSKVQMPMQSIPQPSIGLPLTSSVPKTFQTSEHSLASLTTVYGMPANQATKNTSVTVSTLSPKPLSSAFIGESPLQPVYMTKPVVHPTPSLIQTPHPVKPENHFKHQVMKRYTPAVQSSQRAVINMPVPIQTPMAMRNATLQGQMSGVQGRLVSPVAQLATPLALVTVETRSSRYPLLASSAASEPKLRLDFENVEDTPSVELSQSIPEVNRPTVAPELSTSISKLATQSEVVRSGSQGVDPLAPAMRLKGQWNKNLAGQLFHETLLDEECALYTCRLQGKFAPKPIVDRNHNPVAKVLMEGDDMHFVPIESEFAPRTVTPAGSAFNTCATWT